MSFEDVKGQDQAVKFLKTAIGKQKLSHAYIFAGPHGCGRLLLARNFAKAVNCENVEFAPCDSCLACRKIDNNTHPDVKWIGKDERSRQIKIDEIRGLEREIVLKPYEGKYKVFIIVEAELMNIEAANSFLKTLEEPPKNSLLVLIVERPKGLPPTIVSRCQIVRLMPLATNELTSPDMIEWKNSVLEEFSSDECTQDYAAENRDELSRKLKVLAGWYRDLLVFKATQDEDFLVNTDRIADIKEIAASYRTDKLIRIFENVVSTKQRIEDNVNPKLALSALFKEIG